MGTRIILASLALKWDVIVGIWFIVAGLFGFLYFYFYPPQKLPPRMPLKVYLGMCVLMIVLGIVILVL